MMGDKYISMKCSGCGANLNVASDREVFFCEFCGQKHFLKDENHHKYTYRKVDDARIREADVREAIRLKELEIELLRLQNETRQKRFAIMMKVSIVLAYFIILAAVIFLPDLAPALKHSNIQSLSVLLIPVGGLVVYFYFKKNK